MKHGQGYLQRQPGYFQQPWTNRQESDLLQYEAKGLNAVQIATRMKRTNDSVRSKLIKLRKRARVKVLPKSPAPRIETIVIPKFQVPDFYVKGWRFAGFSAEGLCVMVKHAGCEWAGAGR